MVTQWHASLKLMCNLACKKTAQQQHSMYFDRYQEMRQMWSPMAMPMAMGPCIAWGEAKDMEV